MLADGVNGFCWYGMFTLDIFKLEPLDLEVVTLQKRVLVDADALSG
jgi:hypothetical protein